MADLVGGSIVWNLDVNDKAFNQGIDEAKSKVKDLGDETESSGRKISGALENAKGASLAFAAGLGAVVAGVTAFVGFGTKIAGDLESARQGFVTLLGSGQKADEALAQIKKDAAATPFELTGLVRANQMLTQVTKDAPRSEAVLLNVGKALAAAGKGGEELDRVIVNLQQIANVGKISELDIRQFGFAGINILELLADYYGTTKEAASDMVKDSKDAFKDLESAFAKAGAQGGKFGDAFINQAGTFNQLASNFKDTINIFAADIVTTTGIFDAIKQGLSGVINTLNQFKPQIVQGIVTLIEFVKNNGELVVGIIVGGLVPAFIALAGAVASMVVALAPFVLIGAAIGGALLLLRKAWETNFLGIQDAVKSVVDWFTGTFLPTMQSVFNVIKVLVTIVYDVFVAAFSLIKTIVNEFVIWFRNTAVGQGLLAAFELITTGINKFTPGWNAFWKGIGDVVRVTVQAISDTVKAMVDLIKGQVNSVINAANRAGRSIPGWKEIPQLATGAMNFSGGLALVGEKGPELVNLPGGSDVYTADQTSKMLGSGVTISIDQMNVRDDSDINRISQELGFRIQNAPLFGING